ncbi:hypothetical protein [Plasmodium yoelii yoelii]|uniref:Uncharacterized protein n=1 Tax=Plasmodium yoelii yoelii TaxID=73239 RepID=Q7RIC5_PLAYO|nr:hypothetical protein [Plasmodium yoelii yoelii]
MNSNNGLYILRNCLFGSNFYHNFYVVLCCGSGY